MIISPIAAVAAAAAGLRFPFPRIFDRTVMVTLLAALLVASRALGFGGLMRNGFAAPRTGRVRAAACGLALALAAIAVLFALAIATAHGEGAGVTAGALAVRATRFVAPAIAIGLIEEGFFRAFLLAGMRHDWGQRGALALSSALYALAHLVRAPQRYYLTGFHPGAGLANLAASAAQIAHPIDAAPMLLGLFLLGMVLGRAFLLTGTVWLSAGLHAGFVLGAKSWPLVADAAGRHSIPPWLAGGGPVPLIAAPAAWVIALVLLVLMPAIVRRTGAVASGVAPQRLGG